MWPSMPGVFRQNLFKGCKGPPFLNLLALVHPECTVQRGKKFLSLFCKIIKVL